jgi:hypothetical protein
MAYPEKRGSKRVLWVTLVGLSFFAADADRPMAAVPLARSPRSLPFIARHGI